MSGFFSNIRDKLSGSRSYDEMEQQEGYVELDTESGDEAKSKVLVRPFMLEDFEDIKPVLDSMR